MIVPPSSSFNMGVFNARQKYSPGTGNEFDGVLIRDRQVTPAIGYKVTNAAGITDILNEVLDLTAGTILYHTQEISGSLYNDIASASSLPVLPGITFFPYDSILYDDETYSCEGIWTSAILTLDNDPNTTLKSIEVVADTTTIEIYLRDGCDATDILTQSFVKVGNTIDGTQRIDVSNSNKVYQLAFAWCTGEYSSIINCITSSTVFYYTRSAFFDQGNYFLDDPSFSASYGNYSASTGGRDFIKKAIESKITTPTYTSSTDVARIIRDIADRAGIPNDTTSVPNTGTTVTIDDADNFNNETANDALNECVTYLNGVDDNYRIRINDDTGKLELFVKNESTINADFNYTYKEALISFQKTLLSNNFVQRATVTSGDISTDAEILLSNTNLTAEGAANISWSNDAIHKRIVITINNSTSTVVVVDDISLTDIDVTVSGGTPVDIDIDIYGAETSGTPPSAGESVNSTNWQANSGITKDITNRLIQNDAEAQSVADKMTVLFGNQGFKASLNIPFDPLREIDDKITIWEKFTNTSRIFAIESISHSFTASGASAGTNLGLLDLGVDFANFNWDRQNVLNGGTLTGVDDIKWDSGRLWDEEFGPLVESDTVTNVNDFRNIK